MKTFVGQICGIGIVKWWTTVLVTILITLFLNENCNMVGVNAQENVCTQPFSNRVTTSFLVAEYQFNDRILNPAASVAVNSRADILSTTANLEVQNSVWCEGRVGICLTETSLVGFTGFPVSSPYGFSGFSVLANTFASQPFEYGYTIEFWFRKTQNSKAGVMYALTSCQEPMEVSVKSNLITLAECSNVPTNQINTKAFAASTGATEGFASITLNDNYYDANYKWQVGSRAEVSLAVPGGLDPFATSYPEVHSNGLHYYAHTIVGAPNYEEDGCISVPGDIDGIYASHFPGGGAFRQSVVQVGCESFNYWTYSDFIDGQIYFDTSKDANVIGYRASSENYDTVNAQLQQNYHSNWNPWLPFIGSPWIQGPGCDPNYWRQQIRAPNPNCQDSSQPPTYSQALNLVFGNYQSEADSSDSAQQWQGEILYFAIQRTVLSASAIKRNWEAGPPNTPPVSSEITINMAYCQATSGNFVLDIFDWDSNQLKCSNNVMTGIIKTFPTGVPGLSMTVNGNTIASGMLPFTFPAAQNVQILLATIPVNSLSTHFTYTANDNNGGGAFANTATVTINIAGNTPPTTTDLVTVSMSSCQLQSPNFVFPVFQPIRTACNPNLYVIIESLPSITNYPLYYLLPNGTGVQLQSHQIPFTTLGTTVFYTISPPVESTELIGLMTFKAYDGVQTSGVTVFGFQTAAGGPATAANSTQILVSCRLISLTFTLPITPFPCTRISSIQFTIPSPSQGTLYQSSGGTQPYVPVTSSPLPYPPGTTYQFHLTEVSRNNFQITIPYIVREASSGFENGANLIMSIGALPALQSPSNLTIQFAQCTLSSIPFQLPINLNNSLYNSCPGGLSVTLLGSLPNPTTQGLLSVSTTGINGAYTLITLANPTIIYPGSAYFQFTAPTWNSVNIHYAIKFAFASNYTNNVAFSTYATLSIFVNASQAQIPKPTITTPISVQAGLSTLIQMTGKLGGCAQQASTNILSWLIVAEPAGSSPTQNGSLFFYDPYSLPYFEGERIPGPGIVTQNINGIVNGVSGTYSTYVNPDAAGDVVYSSPFPTGSALRTNNAIIGKDVFYYFIQYGQRFAAYAGTVPIQILNPLQGVSQTITLEENAQDTPVQFTGNNVPNGASAVITSLTGAGKILFHALPIVYPFTIEFEPFTDTTPPVLVYRPPLNTFGHALAIAHFYMSYPGGLISAANYTLTFDVLFVNQPGFFTFVPLPPVYFGANTTITTVNNNTIQAFNTTINNANSIPPVYPWTLTVQISSPSTFSLCCLAGNDYNRIINGHPFNSHYVQVYAQQVFLNQFMHYMTFFIKTLSSSVTTQTILYSIYDNDPVNPKTTNFQFQVNVK